MTGLGFSPASLAQARSSAERTGPPIDADGGPDADRSGRTPQCVLPDLMTAGPDGELRLTRHPERLPLSYTLQARKN
ncbi:hypothetical protein [Nocardia abscessus]|uniref:hypothetical protein n=1 Tax=Nocardia abscessus TaxID=120957 RepID=UPI0024540643|nr:hypothetical protein [Nocardia abscessus]